jgi:hypothetical protein
MKLFLTSTSERGKPVTKSGNDYIEIKIMNENREIIFHQHFFPNYIEEKIRKGETVWCMHKGGCGNRAVEGKKYCQLH